LDEFPHGAGMVGVDTASVVIIDPGYLSDAARGEVAAWRDWCCHTRYAFDQLSWPRSHFL